MVVELVLMRGYMASGKSTIAKTWVAESPKTRARLSRDDLRAAMYNDEGILSREQENTITIAQRTSTTHLLESGISVVIDDTNLRVKYVKEWVELAKKAGASFRMHDVKTPLDICLQRNDKRAQEGGRYVPPVAIQTLAAKFPIRSWPVIDSDTIVTKTSNHKAIGFAVEPYEHQSGLPWVSCFDIDGTIALNQGPDGKPHRGWFEWSKVGDDMPNSHVVDLLRAVRCYHHGAKFIFMSGRDEVCRQETQSWLKKHTGLWDDEYLLCMRTKGDNRPDDIVKYELFNRYIKGQYNVLYVVDDRLKVCRLWHKMGLPLLSVGDPDANF